MPGDQAAGASTVHLPRTPNTATLVAGARAGIFSNLALLALAGLLPASNMTLLAVALGLALVTSLVLFGLRADHQAAVGRVGHFTDGLLVANLTLAAAPTGWPAPLLPLAVAALALSGAVGPRLALALVGWDLWLFVGAAAFGGLPASEAASTGLLASVVGAGVVLALARPAVDDASAPMPEAGLRPRLIAMLSHDLRTPLTSVKGFAQLIQRDRALPETPRRYAEVIVAESNRAIRTIGDAVDLVQMQAGQAMLLPSLVDVARVAANAIATLEPADNAPSADGRLRLKVRGPLPLIRADAARLERVMVHLIATARRYVGDEAIIGVEIAGDPSGVTVWVRSESREISTGRFAHVFSSTARDSALDGEMSGSGLGLYIAKHIAEAHGGRLWVESASGQGTTFAVWLPA